MYVHPCNESLMICKKYYVKRMEENHQSHLFNKFVVIPLQSKQWATILSPCPPKQVSTWARSRK